MSSTTRRSRRLRDRLWTALGVVLIVAGLVAGGLQLFAPQTSERIVGDLRVKTEQGRRWMAGEKYPTVRLSGPGDQADLDACDGTFVEMESYVMPGMQPIHAAHNNCRGEVILPLEVGDKLAIEGRGEWRVTEIRDLSKTWSSSEELLGMEGRLILQTCYWGEPHMKFMAVEPVRPG